MLSRLASRTRLTRRCFSSGVATLKLPDGTEAKLTMRASVEGKDKFVDIGDLYKQTGLYTYDPGLTGTGMVSSEITFIDGDEGILTYRGYPVAELAETKDYMDTVYLLLNGELPNASEKTKFEGEIRKRMVLPQDMVEAYKAFPRDAHPMAMLGSLMYQLAAHCPVIVDAGDAAQHEEACLNVIAKMPMLCANIYRHQQNLPPTFPREDLSYTANFLHMCFSNPGRKCGTADLMKDPALFKELEKAFDVFLMLHADHEQNASTSTVRVAGSALANPYASIAAGIATLWGPSHGGANEAVVEMLKEIGTADKVAGFVDDVKAKKAGIKLMGFGHRVYKNYDPRAAVFKGMVGNVLDKLGKPSTSLQIAKELEGYALKDEYFIKRKLYPNVDFYTGIMLTGMEIPSSMFTVLFALGRTSGWIAQWREGLQRTKEFKIVRPRQVYLGEKIRHVK